MTHHDPRTADLVSVAPRRVLVTGATGYVGSRLIPELLARGHDVVAAVRERGRASGFAWASSVTERLFDIEDDDLVARAVDGVDTVIYLVHSMAGGDFVAKDRAAAERVAAACERSGVQRIVYLSGLVPEGELPDHLASRLQVERAFLDSDVPAVVLRAAMVIGAGSISFELLRRMSARVPVIPVPAWMRGRLQAVATEDIVHLLAAAIEGPDRNRSYDVGGDEVVTYPELLRTFAVAAGLRRRQLVVPFAPHWLVARAVARITGLPRPTVTSLVESISHDMVCREDDVRRDLAGPDHHFLGLSESMRRALAYADDATSRGGDLQVSAPTD